MVRWDGEDEKLLEPDPPARQQPVIMADFTHMNPHNASLASRAIRTLVELKQHGLRWEVREEAGNWRPALFEEDPSKR